MDRRSFLQTSAAVGLAAAASPTLLAQAETPIDIIDTHQHLWDLTQFQPPWLEEASPVIAQSHTIQHYLQAIQGLNITKAIYMEIDVAPDQHEKEIQHVIRMAEDENHMTVAGVVSGRPAEGTFGAYIRKYSDSKAIKGVRQVLHASTPAGFCLGRQFVASMNLLAEMDFSFDLCMRPTELDDAFALAKQCPNTKFILDHCGNADPKAFLSEQARGNQEANHTIEEWKTGISRLATLDNMICKISGIIARAPKSWSSDLLAPIVNHCLDEFGEDRVVFGSDWPVCKLGASLRDWVTALQEIVSNRTVAQQQKLFHGNAQRFYSV